MVPNNIIRLLRLCQFFPRLVCTWLSASCWLNLGIILLHRLITCPFTHRLHRQPRRQRFCRWIRWKYFSFSNFLTIGLSPQAFQGQPYKSKPYSKTASNTDSLTAEHSKATAKQFHNSVSAMWSFQFYVKWILSHWTKCKLSGLR